MELIRAGVRSGRGARSISHRPVPPQQKSDNNTLTSGSVRLVEQRIDARVDTRCSPCLPSAGARARHQRRGQGTACFSWQRNARPRTARGELPSRTCVLYTVCAARTGAAPESAAPSQQDRFGGLHALNLGVRKTYRAVSPWGLHGVPLFRARMGPSGANRERCPHGLT